MKWPARGWRPLLRMAARDAARSRGRSALVLVMIALPVLAVTAAAVVFATVQVSGEEGLESRLGSADALILSDPAMDRFVQGVDPEGAGTMGEGDARVEPRGPADWERLLGRDLPAVEITRLSGRFRTEAGLAAVEVIRTDPASPLLRGMLRRSAGRVPGPGEATVNAAMAERGLEIGDRVELEGGTTLTISGIAEFADVRSDPVLVTSSAVGDLSEPPQRTWLIAGGPLAWDDVVALNRIGERVLSRAAVIDPPARSELPPEYQEMYSPGGGLGAAQFAVLSLIVAMALLEVVLLAGPAFAVGARRQARTMALMSACGGTPAQTRRLVLASALVLGSLAALGGVVAGIALAYALLPIVQTYSGTWFGPFDIPWLQLAAVAGFGLLAALLAALVPARIASRQDVVAVLAGRRGDRAPSRRTPVVGLIGLALGIGLCVLGATGVGRETMVAAGAVVSVLGMILVVPPVLALVARLSRRFPMVLRYAARDAARHRTRTVPAVAAVAATVAGVVTLGIAMSSDQRESEELYTPALASQAGVITWRGLGAGPVERLISRTQRMIREEHPGLVVEPIRGVAPSQADASVYLDFTRVGHGRSLLSQWSDVLGSSVLVATRVPDAVIGLTDAERSRAARALAAGRAVFFTDHAVRQGRARMNLEISDPETGDILDRRTARVPALFLRSGAGSATPSAVLHPTLAQELNLPTAAVGAYLPGPVSPAQERGVGEAVAALSPDLSLTVERGFQTDDTARVIMLILAVLAGVLMLGGTLTATFLALADARPDLATLGAVGAAPRTRRSVGAAYALVLGLIGAVLGSIVGFIPGLAIVRPLTTLQDFDDSVTGPFLDVPWLMIGSLVVALPLVTAGIVGLASRSRLPLVARVD